MNTPVLPAWIDPQELEELSERFPGLEPAVIVEALVQMWPVRAEVEAELARISGDRGAIFCEADGKRSWVRGPERRAA